MKPTFHLPWQNKIESVEIKLVKKAIAGDSNSFAELFNTHKVYLYKLAYSYVKDEDKALDIIQECAYKGLLNIPKLKNPEFFKTWITRVLINVAYDFIKNDYKINCLDEAEPLVYKVISISIEEKLDLYNAIDLLRPAYKTVIILKYFNDMNVNEISYAMDLPTNTVKSHLRRAKAALNSILKEEV